MCVCVFVWADGLCICDIGECSEKVIFPVQFIFYSLWKINKKTFERKTDTELHYGEGIKC